MFLSIGMLKQKYFLADIFILSAEKQPIKLSWRKIECLQHNIVTQTISVELFLNSLNNRTDKKSKKWNIMTMKYITT